MLPLLLPLRRLPLLLLLQWLPRVPLFLFATVMRMRQKRFARRTSPILMNAPI